MLLTSVVSLPPTMLIPSPLASFFSSMLLSSFLAGDFPGDLAGVLLSALSAVVAVGDLAGVFWASALGLTGEVAALAVSGDKVLAVVGVVALGAVAAGDASFASFRFSSSSFGLTTRTLTLPVTCFRIKAAFEKIRENHWVL